LALVQTGRAEALLQGSAFVTPDHIKRRFIPVLRHRVALTADMEIEGVPVDSVLSKIVEQTKAPRM
jgi:MoxR-like ATPase